MIICPVCGRKNEDGEILCSECGSKLKASERLQTGFAQRRETAAPVIKPAEPVIKPAEPVIKPAEPVIKPAESVIKPAEPVIKPAEPVIKPAEPVIKPAEPVVKPAEHIDSVVEITEPLTWYTEPAETSEREKTSSGKWNEVIFNTPVPVKTSYSTWGYALVAVVAFFLILGIVKAVASRAELTDIELYGSYNYDLYSYSSNDDPEVYSRNGERQRYSSGMRLHNGDRIVTGKHIVADVKLGENRKLTMMTSTETVVHCLDEETRIDLNKGAMFYNIVTPYGGEEDLRFVCDSLVISLTEGAGYIFYNGNDAACIWVMNGETRISAYDGTDNAVTGSINPGEEAYITLSDDGVEFTVERVTADSLPPAMVRELSVNGELIYAISPEAGWDRDEILDLAEEYREQDMLYNYGATHYQYIMNDFFGD